MGYILTSLPAYTETQNFPLIHAAIADAETAQLCTIKQGIKGTSTINILSEDASLQPGASTGFAPTGSSTLTQVTITTGYMSVQKFWNPDTLDGFYAQTQLQAGSYPDEIPFHDVFLDAQVKTINLKVENLLWQGNISSSVNDLKWTNGFFTNISSSGLYSTGSFHVSASGGWTAAVTASNVMNILDGVATAITGSILGDSTDPVYMFVGYDFYRIYTTALKNQNLYHSFNADPNKFEMNYPQTPFIIKALHGLDGTGYVVAMRRSNMYLGTDLTSDQDQFKIWYSVDNDQYRMKAKFRVGTGVPFPQECTLWYNGQ